MEERIIANTVLAIDSFHNGEPCWIWTGTLNARGYGHIAVRKNGKPRKALAHRVSYETFVGEIPEGLLLMHLCNNKQCCSPLHLEPGTGSQNQLHRAACEKEPQPEWHREW